MVRGAADGDKVQVKDYSEKQIESILSNYFSNY